MKVVIFATVPSCGDDSLLVLAPDPLVHLVDRPFLQHVVEFLVDRGMTELDLVLSNMAERFEQTLGQGRRWGSRFRFHLAKDALRPYAVLKHMIHDQDEPVLLVHADRLAQIDLGGVPKGSVLFVCPEPGGRATRWTGWAILTPAIVRDIPPDADESRLHEYLLASGVATVEASDCLSVRSYKELLDSQHKVIAGEFELMIKGSRAKDGNWLCRNVIMHPTVSVTPPVYIGQNCRIGKGVQIGPNVCVGRGCLIDQHTTISNALIMPGSYVGQALTLEDAVVDRNRMVSVKIGQSVSVADNFILGMVRERRLWPRVGQAFCRVSALILLLLCLPLMLVTMLVLKLARGRVFYRRQVIQLPAPQDETRWTTFALWSFCDETAPKFGRPGLGHLLLRVIPGLFSIVAGRVALTGVTPRSRQQLHDLRPDWRSLCLRTKAGLITEAMAVYGSESNRDELYSAEAFYSVKASPLHDLAVLLKYARRLFKREGALGAMGDNT